jgi:hypothetical protein
MTLWVGLHHESELEPSKEPCQKNPKNSSSSSSLASLEEPEPLCNSFGKTVSRVYFKGCVSKM